MFNLGLITGGAIAIVSMLSTYYFYNKVRR